VLLSPHTTTTALAVSSLASSRSTGSPMFSVPSSRYTRPRKPPTKRPRAMLSSTSKHRVSGLKRPLTSAASRRRKRLSLTSKNSHHQPLQEAGSQAPLRPQRTPHPTLKPLLNSPSHCPLAALNGVTPLHPSTPPSSPSRVTSKMVASTQARSARSATSSARKRQKRNAHALRWIT
jgi:hypothetical protein